MVLAKATLITFTQTMTSVLRLSQIDELPVLNLQAQLREDVKWPVFVVKI